MLHSDNSYACLRNNNSVCIFLLRKQENTHNDNNIDSLTHTHINKGYEMYCVMFVTKTMR